MLAVDHKVIGFLVPRDRRIVAVNANLDVANIPLGSLVLCGIGGLLLQLRVVFPSFPSWCPSCNRRCCAPSSTTREKSHGAGRAAQGSGREGLSRTGLLACPVRRQIYDRNAYNSRGGRQQRRAQAFLHSAARRRPRPEIG